MTRSKWFVGLALVFGVLLNAAPGLAQTRSRDVVVVNDDTQAVPVRSVDKPAQSTWQRHFSLDWADGVDFTTSTYTVPSNKRLVIEYASYVVFLPPSGQNVNIRIQTQAGGSLLLHALTIQSRSDYGVLKQFDGDHLIKIYADAGSTVTVNGGRVPFVDTANGFVVLSGLLVDVP